MATTTTFEAIRDAYYTAIEALTPAVMTRAEYKFRRHPDRRITVRDWASAQSTDSPFRRFDMRITGDEEEAPILHPGTNSAREVNVLATLTVAYPVLPGMYGGNDLDDLDDVIESDRRQIFDALRTGANYRDGQNNCQVTVRATDRDTAQDVWFKDFDCILTFQVAMTV